MCGLIPIVRGCRDKHLVNQHEKKTLSLLLFVVCLGRIQYALCGTPPTITFSPKVAVLQQYETAMVTLSTGTCSDPDGKSCAVSIQSVRPSNPCGSCFAIYPCAGGKFCLRYLPGQGFLNPASQATYVITLRADDTDSESSTEIVDVRISSNTPPYFNYSTLSISETFSGAAPANTKLFSVEAIDNDTDVLTFSMSTVPATSSIGIDSISGVIRAIKDLRYECRSALSALVIVQDSYNSPVGPLVIDIVLQKANVAPIINNLNTEVRVREDESVGFLVLTLATFDETTFLTGITYSMTSSPSLGTSLFEIKGNELKLKSALDFETQPNTITLTIKASDGFCDSEAYTLTVKVMDINEPPILLPLDQDIQTCEGRVDLYPKWTVSDPDIGDIVKFTDIRDNSLGIFKLSEDKGVVSTLIDYNVDGSSPTTTLVRTVTVSDRRGLTATANLTIRFIDCNDNAPIFVKPANAGSYKVKDCDPAGTVVTTLSAEDKDSTYQQNNVITYSGSGSGVAIQPGGTITLTAPMPAGSVVTFPVYATDKGKTPGPLKSASPAWVSVYSAPCPQTTTPAVKTTTTILPVTNATVRETNSANGLIMNRGWIIMAGLIGGLGTVLFLYMFFRHCWPQLKKCSTPRPGQSTKRNPFPRSITPVRRPTALSRPQQPQPGFIFGWWKENYADDDYEKSPDRNAMPQPSKGAELVDTNTHDVDPIIPPSPSPPPTPTPSPLPLQKSCSIL